MPSKSQARRQRQPFCGIIILNCMIIGYYTGYNFLSLSDVYKHKAWEGLYHSVSTDDPVFLSLGKFREICLDFNINLKYKREWSDTEIETINPQETPIIIFVSGYSEEAEKLIDLAYQGANFVLIKPSFGVIVDEGINRRFEEIKKMIEDKIQQRIKLRSDPINYGYGRLFYIESGSINDYLIEPGPFGNSGNESEKKGKVNEIKDFTKSIKEFAFPLVDVNIKSISVDFPVNEPMYVGIELQNIGNQDLFNTECEVEFPRYIEPVSSTFWQIGEIEKGRNCLIPFYCRVKREGIVNDIISFRMKFDVSHETMKLVPFKMNTIPNFRYLIRESIPINIDTSAMVRDYASYFEEIIDADSFLKLLDIDPDGVIAKSRKIAEYFTKHISEAKLDSFNPKWSFSDNINKLYKASEISNKIRSYLETIRFFGNIAAHSDIDNSNRLDKKDAVVVINALMLCLRECIKKKLI